MSETAAPAPGPGGEPPANQKGPLTWVSTIFSFIRKRPWIWAVLGFMLGGSLATYLKNMADLPNQISYLFHPNSLTSAAVANADLSSIVLHVTNIGREPSYLQTFLWDFGDLPIEKEPLVLADPKAAVIGPRAEVTVSLKVYGLASKVPKRQLQALLDNKTTTLLVDVRESNNVYRRRSVPLPMNLVRDLILDKVPEDPRY
jgi:hypothetical protein